MLQLLLIDFIAYGDDEAAVHNLTAAQILSIGQIVYDNHAILMLWRTDADACLQWRTAYAIRCGIGFVAAGTERHTLVAKRKMAMEMDTFVAGITALIVIQHIPANGLRLSGNQPDAKPNLAQFRTHLVAGQRLTQTPASVRPRQTTQPAAVVL